MAVVENPISRKLSEEFCGFQVTFAIRVEASSVGWISTR